MKDKQEIIDEILSTQGLINDLHAERTEMMKKHQGVLDQYQADFLEDIATLSNKIEVLKWVLK